MTDRVHPFDDPRFVEYYGLRTVKGDDLDLPEYGPGGYDNAADIDALIANTGTPPDTDKPTQTEDT